MFDRYYTVSSGYLIFHLYPFFNFVFDLHLSLFLIFVSVSSLPFPVFAFSSFDYFSSVCFFSIYGFLIVALYLGFHDVG